MRSSARSPHCTAASRNEVGGHALVEEPGVSADGANWSRLGEVIEVSRRY
jgi:hypothetical protein